MKHKVAIVGAQNCGKTTSFYYVASHLKSKGVVMGFVHETARDCPYPINLDSGFIGQWWILSRHIEREAREEKLYDRVLCDRSVFDALVYAGMQIPDRMSLEDFGFIEATAYSWARIHPYDAIIYLTPLPIEIDPSRGKSEKQEEYQKHVSAFFEKFVLSDIKRAGINVQIVREPNKAYRRNKVLEIAERYLK